MKTTKATRAALKATTIGEAQALIGREFTVDGMRHKIEDAWVAQYGPASAVLIEVRIWTSPGRSHSETMDLNDLAALASR